MPILKAAGPQIRSSSSTTPLARPSAAPASCGLPDAAEGSRAAETRGSPRSSSGKRLASSPSSGTQRRPPTSAPPRAWRKAASTSAALSVPARGLVAASASASALQSRVSSPSAARVIAACVPRTCSRNQQATRPGLEAEDVPASAAAATAASRASGGVSMSSQMALLQASCTSGESPNMRRSSGRSTAPGCQLQATGAGPCTSAAAASTLPGSSAPAGAPPFDPAAGLPRASALGRATA
mmetsp:Transcript_80471/g.260753  ORF Transcript_80471/g.260753 Transcript_80471/m.260753 type:complete len:240 (+) Transcript_80471:325-1044(+)